jgi:hypothetical protein
MGNITVITSKERALEVAERYEAQHTKAGKMQPKHEQFYEQLVELTDKSVTSVNDFIGNNSWTNIVCDCCETDNDCAVELPNQDKYLGNYNICLSCLKIANEQIGWTLKTLKREKELNAVNILDAIDEFWSIRTKDTIKTGDITEYIYSVSLDKLTNKKLINFMRGEDLVSIDRNGYVMGGWRKID